MKKLLFFAFGVAMFSPVCMAGDHETTLHLCVCEGEFTTGFKPGVTLGTAQMRYTEAQDIYTCNDFLGYPGATLRFKPTWNKDYKTDPDTYTHPNGTKIVYLEFFKPDVATEPANPFYGNGNFKLGMDFSKLGGTVDDGNSYNTQPDVYSSIIFTGKETGMQYKICLNDLYCVYDDTPDAAKNNTLRRTYAGRNAQENAYIFYMQVSVPCRWVRASENDSWVYQTQKDNPDVNWNYMLVMPYFGWAYEGTHDVGAIDEVVADDNAPVEYYNLQGVRIENPTNGLYIRRQGSKTSKVIIR